MYIIGILIGLYLQISIVFLCLTLIIGVIILKNCYGIIFIKLSNKIDEKSIMKSGKIENNIKNNCNKKSIMLFLFVFFILIGAIHIHILDTNFEEKYANVEDEANIRGVVISEPQDKQYKYTYLVKVKEINGEDKYKDTKLILDINKNKMENKEPKFGDEIQLKGEFEKLNEARNYKGFDYRQYLKSKGIYGIVDAKNCNIIENNKVSRFDRLINMVQNNMKNNINKILDKEEAALCIGILLGDRETISDKTEDNFKKSNLTHMLAVSGSHITYIITALAVLLGKIGKRFTKILTIAILLFFMALTGFTSSVIRACIMGILVIMASLLYRKSDTINNLGISSSIILACNPYAIADLGFLLSYGGTIGIILLGDKIINVSYKILKRITKGKIDFIDNKEYIETKNIIISKVIKYIIISFSITLSANLIIIPIMAYNFSTVSFTFWISNILAAPVMEIVTIFGFMVYFISIIFPILAEFLGIFLNFLLNILLKIAEISSLIPGASIYIKTPYVIECVIYYIIIYAVFNWKQIEIFFKKIKNIKEIFKSRKTMKIDVSNDNIMIKNKYNKLLKNLDIKDKRNKGKNNFKLIYIITIFVAVSVITTINFRTKLLKIYFIDVGQGDCTLIQTPTKKIY